MDSTSCSGRFELKTGLAKSAASPGDRATRVQHEVPPITILYVVNVAWFFLSHRLGLARAALKAGYRVQLATSVTDPQDRVRIAEAGIELHEVSFVRSGTSIFSDLSSIYQLLRLYSRLKPTIVHHVSVKPVIYGGIAARLCRVPGVANAIPGLGYVFASPTLRSRLLRVLLLRLYKSALRHPNSRVIFQNIENRNQLVNAGVVSFERSVLIRGSGVDLQAFSPSREHHGGVTVVLAARMLKEKGIEEFVEAARRLRAEGHPARFQLVGDPDPVSPGSISRANLQAWNDAGDVDWLGFQADMPKILATSHVVCLPTYYGEGLPKVLLEAAACGRPIVTTDIPGCRDIARNGVNARLVAPRDVDALTNALRELIVSRELRERFGAAGRKLVEAEFSIDRVIDQTLAVYRELVRP